MDLTVIITARLYIGHFSVYGSVDMVSPARLFGGRLARLNGLSGKRKEALAGLSRMEEPSTDLPFDVADDAFEVGLVEDGFLFGSAE